MASALLTEPATAQMCMRNSRKELEKKESASRVYFTRVQLVRSQRESPARRRNSSAEWPGPTIVFSDSKSTQPCSRRYSSMHSRQRCTKASFAAGPETCPPAAGAQPHAQRCSTASCSSCTAYSNVSNRRITLILRSQKRRSSIDSLEIFVKQNEELSNVFVCNDQPCEAGAKCCVDRGNMFHCIIHIMHGDKL